MNGGRNRDGKGARLCSHRLTFSDVKSGTKTWKDAEDKERTWPPYSAQQTDLSLFQGRLGHCIQANEAPRLATNCNRKDAKLSLIVNAALTCAPRSSALGQPLFPKSGSGFDTAPQHPVGVGTTWTRPGFRGQSRASDQGIWSACLGRDRATSTSASTDPPPTSRFEHGPLWACAPARFENKAVAGVFLEHGHVAREARSPRFLAANAGFTAHYGPTIALRACDLSAPPAR
jgi:hypothetical protein